MSDNDIFRSDINAIRGRTPRSSSRHTTRVAVRDDAGIPEKVYVPYRALAMFSFTIAIALGMFAILRASSKPETDKQVLEQADARAPITTTQSSTTSTMTDVALCVFNAGSKNGLASQTIKTLRDAKFRVADSGNYMKKQPRIIKTTVFFPKGNNDEANRVVQVLKTGIAQERPDVLTNCPGKIVVLLV